MSEAPRQWHVYGREQGPCLVVQPTALAEAGLASTVILPLTARLVEGDAFPLRVKVPAGTCHLEQAAEIMLERIQACNCDLLREDLGELPEALQQEVRLALREFLDLD
jgi:mRNA-degrading endonuclease toxin of MazEF toxin-antitoxin module